MHTHSGIKLPKTIARQRTALFLSLSRSISLSLYLLLSVSLLNSAGRNWPLQIRYALSKLQLAQAPLLHIYIKIYACTHTHTLALTHIPTPAQSKWQPSPVHTERAREGERRQLAASWRQQKMHCLLLGRRLIHAQRQEQQQQQQKAVAI